MNNKKIYIERLFPSVVENNLFNKLKIDHESIMYITIPYHASIITNIILSHLKKNDINPANIIITDATAGVGGDTISFAKKFKEVIAIELDNTRYNYLLNNVCAYKLENVRLVCNDLIKVIPSIEKHHIIFIDPPWGGKDYKKSDYLKLSIGNKEIESCCKTFFDKTIMKCTPQFIILKLPLNYDLDYLKSKLQYTADIDIYNLYKMIIVVLSNK